MNVVVLAHIASWTDGIPCYSALELFFSREKAEAWLKEEYGDEWEEVIVNDEDVDKAGNDCCWGPEGWQIWEQQID